MTPPNPNFSNCTGAQYDLFLEDASTSQDSIVLYELDWGDGSTPFSSSVFPQPFLQHTYSLGIYELTYIITDINGCTDTIVYDVENLSLIHISEPTRR